MRLETCGTVCVTDFGLAKHVSSAPSVVGHNERDQTETPCYHLDPLSAWSLVSRIILDHEVEKLELAWDAIVAKSSAVGYS